MRTTAVVFALLTAPTAAQVVIERARRLMPPRNPLPALVLALALGVHPSPAHSEFLCAGPAAGRPVPTHLHGAGKLAQTRAGGIQALVLFAGFRDSDSEQALPPDWSSRLFTSTGCSQPGGFSAQSTPAL